ncbi:MAG: hypothetical protein WD846_03470 [Patescibacteria group bacterium]
MSDDLRDISTRGAILAIAIAVIVMAGVMTLGMLGGYPGKVPADDKYQAVFLTNGQVYFGKLGRVGAQYVTLNDVYYIQNNPQQSSPAPSPGPQLSLVQLGNEIHGPERSMQINSDQIIFWEDLKDDGRVVEAINQQQDNENEDE